MILSNGKWHLEQEQVTRQHTNLHMRTSRPQQQHKKSSTNDGPRQRQQRQQQVLSLLLIGLFTLFSQQLLVAYSMELFHVKFMESEGSRLIATSNYNYAITGPKLLDLHNWRAISVNGDKALALTSAGEKRDLNRSELPADIEALRDEIAAAAGTSGGYTHMSTASGGGGGASNFMMSGSSSSYSSSGSTSTMNSANGGGGSDEMSFSSRDDNNFSVAKSDLPLNWSRIFYNNDLVTIVYRNGDVKMLTKQALTPEEASLAERVRNEAFEMQRRQGDQVANTMRNSMDMISNVFNNIMGQFPKPPDYRSSVSGLFGDNFPFGPRNSPFSAESGWPFSSATYSGMTPGTGAATSIGGNGVGAFAFAGRR